MIPANCNTRISEIWSMVGLILAALDCDFYATFELYHAPALIFFVCAILPHYAPRILAGYVLGLSFFVGQSTTMHPKQSCLLSFIIGSILSTQVIAKYVCEVDLYQRGSGNLSQSSLRGLGIHRGIVAIACVLELLKGMTAVYLQGIVGLAWCILGHIMSPWSATGRSGCGSMVLCGGLLYQSPIAVGVAILAWATLSSYGHLMRKNQYGPVCRATQNAWFNVAGGIVAAAACVVTMGELSLLHLLCIAMVALAYVSQSSAQNQEVCQIASE